MGRDWLVMKKQPVWLKDIAHYARFARDSGTCPQFFAEAYRVVYADAIAEYRYVHTKGIEMSMTNILLEFDDANRV